MKKTISPNDIGATLYTPATREDLVSIALGHKYPELQSMVICLEDSVLERDIPVALDRLKKALVILSARRDVPSKPLVFIRPRSLEMARQLVNNPQYQLGAVDGLVLPKFTLELLTDWLIVTEGTNLLWMPTLEDADVYDVVKMLALAKALQEKARNRVLALRIGGNDLMSVLGLRRQKDITLYDGPLGYVIKMLVSVFGSHGFALTSPVCEIIDDPAMLIKELKQDISHGLVGKTAIHPSQIAFITKALQVDRRDYDEALRILNADIAVYKSDGAMCEPATHINWANRIIHQGKTYGYIGCSVSENERFNGVIKKPN